MELGFEGWRLALDAAVVVAALGSGVYAHVRTKDRATAEHIAQLEERLDQANVRLTHAEARIAEGPTSKALHELAVSIEHLSGEIKTNSARLEGVARLVGRLETVVDRQETHLLSKGSG